MSQHTYVHLNTYVSQKVNLCVHAMKA